MAYTDLGWAKTYVLEQLPELGGVAPSNLTLDLEAFAGTLPEGGKMYRPDLWIARWLDTHKGIVKGKGGTEFRVKERIAGYLRRQADLDSAYNLTVPPGTETVAPVARPWPYSGPIKTAVVY